MVAVPTLLTTTDALAAQIERLEVHHLASPGGELYYVLLSDWTDAPTAEADGDAGLLAAAAAGIAGLNRRYPGTPESARFLLLHRRRSWNAEEGQWMGWERKRGKLHEMNRLLRGAPDTSFVAIDGEALSPAALLTRLNQLGHDNGVGRLDLVENRFVGMKSRGVYETPGGTILLAAHRGIESITLDRGAMHLKDELMPKYASLIYNGFWFAPEREMLQAAIDLSQAKVTGQVRVKLYKGNVTVIGRTSPYSLYDQELVTFEEGKVAYDHRDAAGFIKLNALRLRVAAKRDKLTN